MPLSNHSRRSHRKPAACPSLSSEAFSILVRLMSCLSQIHRVFAPDEYGEARTSSDGPKPRTLGSKNIHLLPSPLARVSSTRMSPASGSRRTPGPSPPPSREDTNITRAFRSPVNAVTSKSVSARGILQAPNVTQCSTIVPVHVRNLGEEASPAEWPGYMLISYAAP